MLSSHRRGVTLCNLCDLMERNLQKAWGSYAGFLDQYADEATSRNDMRKLQQLRGNLQNNQWALLTMQFLRNPQFKERGAGFEDYFAVNDLVNMRYVLCNVDGDTC